jgi:hypothetical protein
MAQWLRFKKHIAIKNIFLYACFFSFNLNAESIKNQWDWYYIGMIPRSDAKQLFTRTGKADVVIKGEAIAITFYEGVAPEDKSYFNGKIINGMVDGVLTIFFPSADESLSGALTRFTTGIAGGGECVREEIELYNGLSNGSRLMLARMTGDCG